MGAVTMGNLKDARMNRRLGNAWGYVEQARRGDIPLDSMELSKALEKVKKQDPDGYRELNAHLYQIGQEQGAESSLSEWFGNQAIQDTKPETDQQLLGRIFGSQQEQSLGLGSPEQMGAPGGGMGFPSPSPAPAGPPGELPAMGQPTPQQLGLGRGLERPKDVDLLSILKPEKGVKQPKDFGTQLSNFLGDTKVPISERMDVWKNLEQIKATKMIPKTIETQKVGIAYQQLEQNAQKIAQTTEALELRGESQEDIAAYRKSMIEHYSNGDSRAEKQYEVTLEKLELEKKEYRRRAYETYMGSWAEQNRPRGGGRVGGYPSRSMTGDHGKVMEHLVNQFADDPGQAAMFKPGGTEYKALLKIVEDGVREYQEKNPGATKSEAESFMQQRLMEMFPEAFEDESSGLFK
jgi:hypothetical protein